KYYRYHCDHGHDTEECSQLKNQIEDLIRRGHLRKYVDREAPQDKRERGRDEAPCPEEGQQQKPMGVIHTISGGVASGGDHKNARKAYGRQSLAVQQVHHSKRLRTGEDEEVALSPASSLHLERCLTSSRSVRQTNRGPQPVLFPSPGQPSLDLLADPREIFPQGDRHSPVSSTMFPLLCHGQRSKTRGVYDMGKIPVESEDTCREMRTTTVLPRNDGIAYGSCHQLRQRSPPNSLTRHRGPEAARPRCHTDRMAPHHVSVGKETNKPP
ncbi:hypothetical protein CFOL_v3_01722, partial [Cephalotus follicularis]